MRVVLQRHIVISVIIFVAYKLNLLLNMEKPHYRSQRAGEWSLSLAHVSRLIYRGLTYIAVPLLGPHQPRYIESTLYTLEYLSTEGFNMYIGNLAFTKIKCRF